MLLLFKKNKIVLIIIVVKYAKHSEQRDITCSECLFSFIFSQNPLRFVFRNILGVISR